VKDAIKRDDAEEMKSASEALTQSWHEVSAEMYAQTKGHAGPRGAQPGPERERPSEPSAEKGEDVIDADYEVVDDDKDKNAK